MSRFPFVIYIISYFVIISKRFDWVDNLLISKISKFDIEFKNNICCDVVKM